ncbi:hypothetical protein [Thiomicrorhabdus lithotrophica]|uniref:Bacteriophage tail tape measure N-terminal domain-containing protein n=1 Tax=Thiomicrorhabdus lithotrophica TaxID=2949997 RepID=A0ABY8C856_9GAMM|nr:hypothetical protein [Thiomicrorhabdus lithotrophica]WEJ62151.1 hypothetical protein NR989_09035 [Thiomicrorhabdus lithotrophica]
MGERLKYILDADAKPFNSAVGSATKGAKQFESANKKAGSESSRALSLVENRLVKMNKLQNSAVLIARGMGAAFAIAGAAGGAGFVWLTSLTDEMDRAGKTADKLGLTTQELTSLRYAVEQTSEMTGAQFDVALQRMTRRLAEAAQGTGEARNAIAELGLDAQALNAMSPEQAFKAIADQMAQVDSQSDRVRLAFKLFDTEGVNLVNTLSEGSAEINRLQKNAISMGIAFDDKAAKGAERFNDELTDLQASFKGTMVTFVNESGILDTLNNKFKSINETLKIQRETAAAAADPLTSLYLQLDKLDRQREPLLNPKQSWIFGIGYDVDEDVTQLKALTKRRKEILKEIDTLLSGRNSAKPSNKPTVLPPVNIGATPPKKPAVVKGDDWRQMLDSQTSDFGDNPFATPSATSDWSGMLDEQTGLFDSDIAAAQNQMQTLSSLYAEGLDREQMFRDERLAMVQNALDQEAVSVEQAARIKNQIEEDYQRSQLATASEGFGMIANLMNTNSKEMFEIGKKAAIVQTTIDTYQMATSAYKAMVGIPFIGPALGAAAAASAVAFGLAQVSSISSQQFTPSAEGGFDIPAGVNPVTQLHEKEMVLPKAQAEVIRNLANANGNGAGGVVVNIHNAPGAAEVTEKDGQIDIRFLTDQVSGVMAKDIVKGVSPMNTAFEQTYGTYR